MSVHTVAPHQFSDSQRKCRGYSCFDADAPITLRRHRGRREKDLAGGYKTVPLLDRVHDAVIVIERRQLRQSKIVDVHMPVEFIRRTDLKYINFSNHVLVQAEVVHVIERLECSLPQPRRRQIRRHCLPTGAQVTTISKVRSVQNLIGVTRRSLLPHVFGIMYAIDLAVFVIPSFKTLTRRAILLPIHRVRKYEPPVATQIDIRLF